ncbi:gcn5-related n-acetyltransferase [Leptolyngbya sp. Heron Island J]|uniref:GNAT family N-acetyltransferase n=1 Tax=Leptolyngbya sp. Heron Island J TaxID=1385935 RepID=UPI0003B9FA30|nr:GNAT family N-acetyltransferase [Leptolyngbya sp. Heron Island J]ESA33677.1 gcn5-related n-acetyltransferase [Leptolyngbya sp. Heron Island J]
MEVLYRAGQKTDVKTLAELEDIASGGAVEFLFHDLMPGVSAVQFVASGLEQDVYPHSYRSAIVAELNHHVIGMALSFPATYHQITPEMRDLFPPDRLEHFQDFFSARVEGSFFLDALCVLTDYQHKGIGSRLIELTKSKAQTEGYNSLSLIVLADNIGAQRLYQRHGFESVRSIELHPHPLMPHQGGALLMRANL